MELLGARDPRSSTLGHGPVHLVVPDKRDRRPAGLDGATRSPASSSAGCAGSVTWTRARPALTFDGEPAKMPDAAHDGRAARGELPARGGPRPGLQASTADRRPARRCSARTSSPAALPSTRGASTISCAGPRPTEPLDHRAVSDEIADQLAHSRGAALQRGVGRRSTRPIAPEKGDPAAYDATGRPRRWSTGSTSSTPRGRGPERSSRSRGCATCTARSSATPRRCGGGGSRSRPPTSSGSRGPTGTGATPRSTCSTPDETCRDQLAALVDRAGRP